MSKDQESVDGNVHDLMKPELVAKWLQVSTVTLSRWRREGRGPAFVAVGRCVRYRKSAIAKYIEGGEVRSTAEKHSKSLKARAREQAEQLGKELRSRKQAGFA